MLLLARMTTVFLCCSLLGLAQDFEEQRAANWHQWRGPMADGVALNGNPPVKWSATENVRWKTPIPGLGSATPVVWGDQVFVATAVPTEERAPVPPQKQSYQIPPPPKTLHRFVLMSVSLKTGDVLWTRDAIKALPHEGHHKTHSFAAGSPITNGKQVFVSFGSRGVYAFDVKGNPLWNRDLGDMQTRRGWGEGASPALHGETLIVNWDHEAESFIVALDARSGDVRWRAERDEPTSWATPLIVSDGRKTQVVVPATNQMKAYDLETGDVLWHCDGLHVNVIPSPVARDGVVYCMSNYRRSAAFAIPLSARGDVRRNGQIIWSHTGNTPYCPSPLLYQGRLYFTSQNNAILSVLDAKSGKPTCDPFRLTSLRSIYASPVAAAGHVYVTGRGGSTLVFDHGDKPKLIATNSLGEPVDASPVIVGDRMLIRGQQHLFCIAE